MSTASWVAAATALGATHIWPLNDTTGTAAVDQGSAPSNGLYNGSPVLSVPVKNQTGVLLNGAQSVTFPAVEFPSSAPWSFEIYGALAPLVTQTSCLFSGGQLQLREGFTSTSPYGLTSMLSGEQMYAQPLGYTLNDATSFTANSGGTAFYVTRKRASGAQVNTLEEWTPGNAAATQLINFFGTDFASAAFCVDSSGNVYVATGSTVYKFAAGSYLTPVWQTTLVVAGAPIATSICINSAGTTLYIGGSDADLSSYNGFVNTMSASTGGSQVIVISNSSEANAVAGVAVDSSGNIFVVTGSEIVKYNSGGGYLTDFGNTGTAIAVDSSGNVYFGTTTLYKYNNALSTMADSIAVTQTIEAIAIDTSGNVYATFSDFTLRKYGSTLASQLATTTLVNSTATMGVSIDGQDNIYTMNAYRYGVYNTSLALQSCGQPAFTGGPPWVQVDASGNVYYLDGSGYFHKLAAATGIITSITDAFTTFCLDSTPTYAYALTAAGACSKITLSTMASTNIFTISGASGVACMAIDSSSNTYVYNFDSADPSLSAVYQYNSAGTQLQSWATGSGIYGIAIDSSNNMYLLNSTAGQIQKYASGGLTPVATYAYSSTLATVAPVGYGLAIDSTGTYFYFLGTYDGSYYGIVRYTIGAVNNLSMLNLCTFQPKHYVLTYNGTNYTLSVNAVAVGSAAATLVTSGASNASNDITIGAMQGTLLNGWIGTAADAAIYPTALTPSQIHTLFQSKEGAIINGYTSGEDPYTLVMQASDSQDALAGCSTLEERVRVIMAALGGVASGLNTNAPVFMNITNTKARISATTDVTGDRTAVTLTGN